jgi:ferredoxin
MVNFDYKYQRNKLGKMGLDVLEEYLILKDKEKNPNYKISAKELKKLERIQKNIFRNRNAYNNINKMLIPEFSNKMAAIASGIGRLGWSGLVMTEKYGARIFFNTVITDAKLKPDKPLEKNPCDKCKICVKTCQASYFLENDEQKITIAGIEEVMGKHRSIAYCETLCGGLIGKVGDTEWSTWIPYRLKEGEILPGEDSINEYVGKMTIEAILEGDQTAKHLFNLQRIVIKGYNAKPKDQHIPSCSMCMAVCGPTLEDRKKSFELLKNSGNIEIEDFEYYYGTSEFK